MTCTSNTPANKAAYLAKGGRFFWGYLIAFAIAALLFRGGGHDPDSAMQILMMAPGSLLAITSAWVGSAACEFIFTLRGFGSDYLYAEDAFPRWYPAAKLLSGVAGLLAAIAVLVAVCVW